MKPQYSTQATAIGGRTGWVGSVDGALRVKLTKPKSLGGAGGPGGNPEHLFAAAYAASFLEALQTAAIETRQSLTEDANVTVTAGLRPRGEGPGLALEVSLSLDLPNISREAAQVLAARAHTLCPYSHALQDSMSVRLFIV